MNQDFSVHLGMDNGFAYAAHINIVSGFLNSCYQVNNFKKVVDLADIYSDSKESKVVKFADFLDNIKNNVADCYIWTNDNGEDEMSYSANNVLTISSSYVTVGYYLNLDLSDHEFKQKVLTELGKLLEYES